MGYDRGDSIPFDFEPDGILFGSKSKGKLSPRYHIKFERNWKSSFLSVWFSKRVPGLPNQNPMMPRGALSDGCTLDRCTNSTPGLMKPRIYIYIYFVYIHVHYLNSQYFYEIYLIGPEINLLSALNPKACGVLGRSPGGGCGKAKPPQKKNFCMKIQSLFTSI